jgi:hypothetical protein
MIARSGVVGDDARRFWQVFDLLTRESLDYCPAASATPFSGICRDGSPWQYCVTMDSRSAHAVRFLTEVGAPGTLLQTRTALSVERAAEGLDLIGVRGHRETVQLIANLTPPDDRHIAGMWVGFAVGPGTQPRLRLYANNGWGDTTERWMRLIRALRSLNAGGFGARLEPLLGWLLPSFTPNGFAITLPPTSPLCKLYFRPSAEPWGAVRAMAQAVLGSGAPTFLAAIEDAFERPLESFPHRALVLSMSGPAIGGPLDFKLDLCGHCLFSNDTSPPRTLERLANALGLNTAPYASMVADCGGHGMTLPHEMIAFLGIGAGAAGSRVNVYFTAPCFGRLDGIPS